MDLSSICGMQRFDHNFDGNLTVKEVHKIDANQDGQISQSEGLDAGLETDDLPEINQAYQTHKSDPQGLVFSREVLQTQKVEALLSQNFEQLDGDGDGQLELPDLVQGLNKLDLSSDEKMLLGRLIMNFDPLTLDSGGTISKERLASWTQAAQSDPESETVQALSAPLEPAQRDLLSRMTGTPNPQKLLSFVQSHQDQLDPQKTGKIQMSAVKAALKDPKLSGYEDRAMVAKLYTYFDSLAETVDQQPGQDPSIDMADLEALTHSSELGNERATALSSEVMHKDTTKPDQTREIERDRPPASDYKLGDSIPLDASQDFNGLCDEPAYYQRMMLKTPQDNGTVSRQTVRIYTPQAAFLGEGAIPEAADVAEAVASLPPELQTYVKSVVVNPVQSPNDAYWQKKYDNPNHQSFMDAGKDGVITIYPSHGDPPNADKLWKGMLHEVGHIFSQQAWGTDETGPGWKDWREAMSADQVSSSDYADKSPQEDVADTLRAYILSKDSPEHEEYRAMFPHRFEILDRYFAQSDDVCVPG